MAKLLIKRPFQWTEPLHSYKIYIDQKRIGKIFAEETKEFDIAPGKHIIKAKYRIFSSKPVSIEVKNDDETIQMQVSNNQQIWDMIPFGLISSILIGNVIKLMPPDAVFLSFVIVFLIAVFSMWLVYQITPYLKLEQVEDKSKITGIF